MEYRTLEVNVMSATGLNKVNLISKMDVYVVVFIKGTVDKKKQKQKTPANNNGDTNPSWECSMKFTIDEIAARQNRLTLCFKLRCERALGDKDIGEVQVPVKELLDSPAATDGRHKFLNYQVSKPNGKSKGQLSFSYKFEEKITGSGDGNSFPAGPSTVYPPLLTYPSPVATTFYPPYGYHYPPPSPYGGYAPAPPPHGPYGYVYPPPPQTPDHGYGYAPPPGYGYQQGVPTQNNFGMGLGGGLLGGALGGSMIGDAVSNASAYVSRYRKY